MDKDLEIFCVTDKHLDFFNDIKYKLAAVGKNNFPSNYITCNTGKNIFYKDFNLPQCSNESSRAGGITNE